MSAIENLLKDKQFDKADYDSLLNKFPWINERKRYCILSPDSDGLLCGLFMSMFRDWKIVGFYDDKVGVVNNKYLDEDIVLLDGEIFRKSVKSVGHHMLKLNKNRNVDFSNFSQCIQPNLLRNYDGKHDFRLKYPLATIHLLVSIIAYSDYKQGKKEIVLTEKAVAPLFFTDGVFNVLFSYPENVLNWLYYLRIHEDWNPLKNIFKNESFSVYETMELMHSFFKQRDEITKGKERGDRLKISSKDGTPYNIEKAENDLVEINEDAVERIKTFANMIANSTGWNFIEDSWLCWKQLRFFQFNKSDFKSRGWKLTNTYFESFLELNPLSWAMTSGENIEFTLEKPSSFLK
ncbi:MAG: hypothetical protein IJ944_03975 [Clostridia bacterium]|nr:hypothetical protein [Clostridia bacterium]